MTIDHSNPKNQHHTIENRSRTLMVTNLITKSTNLLKEIHSRAAAVISLIILKLWRWPPLQNTRKDIQREIEIWERPS